MKDPIRITSITRCWQPVRRFFSRSHWAVWGLGMAQGEKRPSDPGLVIVQIDDLSEPALMGYLERHQAAFLNRLLRLEAYQCHRIQVPPEQSNADFQAELLFGTASRDRQDRAFAAGATRSHARLADESSSKQEGASASDIRSGLLQGGSSYANEVHGDAREIHFPRHSSASSIGRETNSLGRRLVTEILHPWSYIRTGSEWVRRWSSELLHRQNAPSTSETGRRSSRSCVILQRAVQSVYWRDRATQGASRDIARGLPIVLVSYLGYSLAHQSSHQDRDSAGDQALCGIDRSIRQLWRAAAHASHRTYDLWILSNRGCAILPKDALPKAFSSREVELQSGAGADFVNVCQVDELHRAAREYLTPAVPPSLTPRSVATGSIIPSPGSVDASRCGLESNSISLVTYNVHACMGMDGQMSPRRIARVIAQAEAEIVCLQELDVHRRRSQFIDQAREIAHQLQMHYQFHHAWHVEEERFGNAILTRLPMQLIRQDSLFHYKQNRSRRSALWVEVEIPSGQKLQIINTHLSIFPREQREQARELVNRWITPARKRGPVILCGDFNARPHTVTHRTLAHAVCDVNHVHASRHRATYFSPLPLARLDHIFVSDEILVERVEVASTRLARIASDHLPLLANIRLTEGSEPNVLSG